MNILTMHMTTNIPAQKIKRIPRRNWIAIGITILLLFMPLYVIHAQLSESATITFSTDSNGNWEYTSGFHDASTYHNSITSDGRGSSGAGTDTIDTGIHTTVKMEVFVADTNGHVYKDPCSSVHFTGNPATDFACEATAAEGQGYAYTMGQTWQDAPAPTTPAQTPDPIATTPCKCPY